MRLTAVILSCSVYVSVLSLCASADNVMLKNGDRVSGDIILMEGANLVLSTNYGGDITISKDQIQTLESKQPLMVKQVGQLQGTVESIQTGPQGNVRVGVGVGLSLVDLNNIDQIMKPQPNLTAAIWKGTLTLRFMPKRLRQRVKMLNLRHKQVLSVALGGIARLLTSAKMTQRLQVRQTGVPSTPWIVS